MNYLQILLGSNLLAYLYDDNRKSKRRSQVSDSFKQSQEWRTECIWFCHLKNILSREFELGMLGSEHREHQIKVKITTS